MRYWWVNHKQTYKSEVAGNFLWSPKTRSDGSRNQFYDNMREVAPGDLVFSFSNAQIKAIGRATGSAETSPKPHRDYSGTRWPQEGWLVPVTFVELTNRVRPKDHIEIIRPHLPQKYSPLQTSGNGLQSVYLAEISSTMAEILLDLIGPEGRSVVSKLLQTTSTADENDEEYLVIAIRGRTDIGDTTKEQLIKARRGQGIFRANVCLNEKRCRITKIDDPAHLRASHIKPWLDCSDEEKLDGCNGLLLAPHVDHLFDKGLISFSDSGDLLISPQLDLSILEAWGIPTILNVGRFSPEQTKYLSYHRRKFHFH